MGAAAGGGVVEEEVEKGCCGSQLLLVDMQSKEEKKKNSNSWVLPPGFRFHPTDEELVLYYLKRKILRRHIHLPSFVGEVDVYKWQPWELPALLTTTTTTTSSSNRDEKQWYLFSPRDRKYPNGSRSNRATQFGYWKSTGKDRPITTQRSRSSRRTSVGNKKTLVYYHGRAPRGQRTDWVMHEYTLLLDLDTNYDCYALYKLFRKSGPGPKNGEHYGAPFQEEDWEDDDYYAHDIFHKQTPPATSKQVQVDTNATLPDYNLEQVLLKLSRELDVDHQYHSQVEDEVVQSDQLVGLSSRADATTSAQHTTNTWWEQGAGETSNQIAPSTSVVCVQTLEMSGVTSTLIGCSEQGQLKTDEDKEFLEIADFGDPGSAVWSMEDNSNNVVCLPKNDGLYDPFDYYYFDAEMYLAEALGPLDGATPPNLYLDDFGEENQATSHMISELWTHEQDFSVSAATTEPNQVASMTSVSTASGVLSNNGSLSDIGGGDTHQEPISDSWFSSALSAFLDSVPSSPAIAAESPLISKALQRVSSFRTPGGAAALVPNAAAAAAATGNGRRRRRRRRGAMDLRTFHYR